MPSKMSLTSNIPLHTEAAFLHLPFNKNNSVYIIIIFIALNKYWLRFILIYANNHKRFSLSKLTPDFTFPNSVFISGNIFDISDFNCNTALSAFTIHEINVKAIIISAIKIIAINKNILNISYFVLYWDYRIFKRDWEYA